MNFFLGYPDRQVVFKLPSHFFDWPNGETVSFAFLTPQNAVFCAKY